MVAVLSGGRLEGFDYDAAKLALEKAGYKVHHMPLLQKPNLPEKFWKPNDYTRLNIVRGWNILLRSKI